MATCFTYNHLFARALWCRATHQLRDMTHTAVYSLVPCGLTPHSSSTITLEHALTFFFFFKRHDPSVYPEPLPPIQFLTPLPSYHQQPNFSQTGSPCHQSHHQTTKSVKSRHLPQRDVTTNPCLGVYMSRVTMLFQYGEPTVQPTFLHVTLSELLCGSGLVSLLLYIPSMYNSFGCQSGLACVCPKISSGFSLYYIGRSDFHLHMVTSPSPFYKFSVMCPSLLPTRTKHTSQ